MTPIEGLLELGLAAGMNEKTTVLDLCCGYGTMLKIWSEAFGCRGVGVDACTEFIREGRERLGGNDLVNLVEADVTQWRAEEKFDFACLSGEDFGGFRGTIGLLSRFVKASGTIIIGTRYARTENPPQALIDFEGETLTLRRMNQILREEGWYLVAMATDTPGQWERYIMWSARRSLAALRQNPQDEGLRAWCDTWYNTYFDFRREHEGYVTLAAQRL